MADYGASIRQLPATALDPDQLEQTYAAGIARQVPAGYQMPFLFGAMLDRQRRGQQLADANVRGNQQAYDLAQQSMGVDERNSIRTLSGTLGPHGMPLDAHLLVPGMMPTPESANSVAGTANPILEQGGQARAAHDLGVGAHGAIQGGVDPLALPGMPQARVTPLGLQTARAGAGASRETWTVDPMGDPSVQFRNPPDPAAAVARGQEQIRGSQETRAAALMRSQNQQTDATAREIERRVAVPDAQGRPGRVVSQRASPDGNSMRIVIQRGNQIQEHIIDRRGGHTEGPVQTIAPSPGR